MCGRILLILFFRFSEYSGITSQNAADWWCAEIRICCHTKHMLHESYHAQKTYPDQKDPSAASGWIFVWKPLARVHFQSAFAQSALQLLERSAIHSTRENTHQSKLIWIRNCRFWPSEFWKSSRDGNLMDFEQNSALFWSYKWWASLCCRTWWALWNAKMRSWWSVIQFDSERHGGIHQDHEVLSVKGDRWLSLPCLY